MHRRTDDITLTGESGHYGSFLVVHITRESGSFSVTADEYASEKAYRIGNDYACIACGCLHDEVLKAFPHLAPIVRLHLADVETGEPMHGPSNGWYHLSGGSAQHEIDYRRKGSKNYANSPDDIYSAEWQPFWLRKAADALRCEIEELPTPFGQSNDEYELAYNEWIDKVMRPRWRREAEAVNLWIDSNLTDIDPPNEQTDEEEFEIELDAGLHVRAEHDGEDYVNVLGGNYVNAYNVKVWVDGIDHTYEVRSRGSINDYIHGVVNARESAFGTLRELNDFIYETAEGWIESCGDDWDDLDEETKAALKRADETATIFEDALQANMGVIA